MLVTMHTVHAGGLNLMMPAQYPNALLPEKTAPLLTQVYLPANKFPPY